MDLVREFFLEAFPNPNREGCPDEETLMALAGGRLPIENPVCLHVASCSECFAEFTGCIVELEAQKDAKVIADPAKVEYQSMPWSGIASALDNEKASGSALQRLRQRISAYRHRGENQET
jgi:hypothetical protein